MKKWKCTVCNYVHTGDEPPEVCPICGAGREKFVEIVEDSPGGEELAASEVARADGHGFLVEQILKRHVHPMSVHAPNGVIPVSAVFVFLAVIFDLAGLAEAAFYNLIFVLAAMPLVWISGIVEWREKYKGELTRSFVAKLICAAIVTVTAAALILWHAADPVVAGSGALSKMAFLLLNAVMLGATMVAGFIGGKLVFKD